MSTRILMPLPDTDFDVTEASVPWQILTQAGLEVVFATESGTTPQADPLLLTGVLFGQLGAEKEPIAFYREMEKDASFRSPLCWKSIDFEDFDGLWLCGGHAPGMRQYLGNTLLQEKIAAYFEAGLPTAAICHGPLLLARAKQRAGADAGKSVLYKRRTTCLPTYMERIAYYLTAWKLGRYYRTYDAYVQEEVGAALGPGEFVRGPINLISRGTKDNSRPAFVVEDGAYLSARWPGDAYLLSQRFAQYVQKLAGQKLAGQGLPGQDPG